MSTLRMLAMLFCCVSLALGLTQSAMAQGKKFALVVGNNEYTKLAQEQQLRTAENDAKAVAAALESIGFEKPTVVLNATRSDMVNALHDFATRIGRDDTAVFYFAGHGVNFGANILLPSDIPSPASTSKEEEIRLAELAITEKFVLQTIARSNPRVFLAVFDACRDNPLNVAGDPTRGIRGAGRGLVAVPPEMSAGHAVLYSAGTGQRALDRLDTDDINDPALTSVFTRIFVKEITTPGRGLRSVSDQLKIQVPQLALQHRGHRQTPGFYDQFTGEVYLGTEPAKVPGGVTETDTPPPPPISQSNALEEWKLVEHSRDVKLLEAFRDRHTSDKFFKALAESAIENLRKPAAAPKAEPVKPNESTVMAVPDPPPKRAKLDDQWANIKVVYFRKERDGRKVDNALKKLGISADIRPSGFAFGSDFRDNISDTLVCTQGVPLRAVRALALALLDAGVVVRAIVEPHESVGHLSGRIQIESTGTSRPALKRSVISKLQHCPSNKDPLFSPWR